MTYGQLKFRLTKAFPGIDLDLLEGWINDRYDEILGELPWTRQSVNSELVTTAPYATGTIAVLQGSTVVTLTSGTWTSGMTGMQLRVTGSSVQFYTFTYLSGTTGTLERPYGEATAPSVGYSLSQAIYTMPADCRMLDGNAFAPLVRFDNSQLDITDAKRKQTGDPHSWASWMDDNSTPPRLQVELYPVPNKAVALPFTYIGEGGDLTSTATILQIWIQPTALVAGVESKIRRHLRDLAGSQMAAAEAKAALANMRTSNAQGMAPAAMQIDPYLTAHRLRRTCR